MGTLLVARLSIRSACMSGHAPCSFRICRVGGISLTLLVLLAAAIMMLARFWPQ